MVFNKYLNIISVKLFLYQASIVGYFVIFAMRDPACNIVLGRVAFMVVFYFK